MVMVMIIIIIIMVMMMMMMVMVMMMMMMMINIIMVMMIMPRTREDFSNVTRIGGAPSSLVPPGTAPCLPTGPARWQSRQASEEESLCCVACTSGNGRRVARDSLPVRLPRVSFHQRRRRRGGHAPSHGHRG